MVPVAALLPTPGSATSPFGSEPLWQSDGWGWQSAPERGITEVGQPRWDTWDGGVYRVREFTVLAYCLLLWRLL